MKEPSIYVHLGIKGFLIFFHMGANMLERTLFESFHVGIVPYASEIECILECDERNNIAGLFAFHFRWFY